MIPVDVAACVDDLVTRVISNAAGDYPGAHTREQVIGDKMATAEDVTALMNAELEAEQRRAAKAEAEVATLKRKYEPDTGILSCKMLRLSDDYGTVLMRVTVHTGGYLLLELVPRARHRPAYPNWQFYPSLEGRRDNVQDFGDYGTYEVSIGSEYGQSHDLLVTFSEPATVDITVVTDHDGNYGTGPDEMSVEELTTPAAVTLTIGDDS